MTSNSGSIKKDINIFIPANNTAFVSVVAVFVIFLIILFLKPELFFMAFKTFLGNVVLLFVICDKSIRSFLICSLIFSITSMGICVVSLP